jgi:glycine dehydrogenase subunit 1
MAYTVHTDADRRALLEVVGLPNTEALFSAIPAQLRVSGLDLAPGLSEPEARSLTEALASADRPAGSRSFLGAGYYRHFVPAAVRALASRGEFATAYTPYQPEVSQGTLQHIFEFQTCICELAGLQVANASLYDGPSALAEAAFMALRLTHGETVSISAGVHPQAIQVVDTYCSGPGMTVERLSLDGTTGTTIVEGSRISAETGVVLVQQPNCLGVIEDLEALAKAAHAVGALLVVSVNPATLGVLEAPGMLGADIVVGDAQVFGCAPTFGGPSVGFLACGAAHVRQIPGRLVSQTLDVDGKVCYTLTLQAREQHIRRAKATSNICSNQALSALAATIYLALLGPQGLRELGELCLSRAHHLHHELCRIPGVEPFVSGPFFYEFALALPCRAADFVAAMREHGVDPGVPLTAMERGALPVTACAEPAGAQRSAARPTSPPADTALVVAVTEVNSRPDLDHYLETAARVIPPLAARSATRAGAGGAASRAGSQPQGRA